MNRLSIAVWFLAPLALLVWHYSGPGQKQLAKDVAGEESQQAAALLRQGQSAQAAEAFRQALAALPDSDVAAQRRLRLAWAKADVAGGELVDGQERLRSLLTELERDSSAAPQLVQATRHALAESSYYAAYLMRLEGGAPDDWVPQSENARQHFRLLAEEEMADTTVRETAVKNLEATIKLQQMDLSRLLAAPPPSKCPKCKNICKRQKKNRNNNESESEGGNQQPSPQQQPQDVRKEMRKAFGSGMSNEDGSGS